MLVGSYPNFFLMDGVDSTASNDLGMELASFDPVRVARSTPARLQLAASVSPTLSLVVGSAFHAARFRV